MTESAVSRPITPLGITLIYAAVAGLWIVSSDLIVEALFGVPVQITLVSMIKGGVFVTATTLLLYFLLQRRAAAPLAIQPNRRGLLLSLLVLSAVIIGITTLLSLKTLEQKKAAEFARLQAVSLLKTEQIITWLQERQRDANLLQNSPFLAEAYQRWRQQGDTASRDRLLDRLNAYRKENVFQGVVLLDEQGTQLWRTNDSEREKTHPIAAHDRARFLAAVARENVSRLGPYLDTAGRNHLDYVVRLPQKGGQPGPIIVLHSDAENFFPVALSAWPVPSVSGEIFLFKRDGDHFIFLSNLRHQADVAMKLRQPLSDTRRLASQVINDPGKLGQQVEGIDYRNTKVAGIARAIPGTDWFLMTKLDRQEMLAEANRSVAWITLSGLLALIVAGAGLVLTRQRQQIASAQTIEQAQSERLRALHLLAAIADSSSDAIFALDLEGRFILFNRAAQRLTGQTQEDVLGRDETALFPSDIAERQSADNHRVIDSNITLNFQEEVPTAKGKRTFLTTKGPLHDSEGSVIGLYGISRDISERTQIEAALHERETSFRLLTEKVPAIIYRAKLDELSQTVYISPRVNELGYTPAEWLAAPDIWLQSLHPDDLPQVLAKLEAFRNQGGTLSLAYRLRTRAGEWRHFQDEAEILLDESDQPLYLQGLMLDVTARHEIEAELSAAHSHANMLADLLNHSAQPFGQGFADGSLGFHNPAFLDLVGYTEDEFTKINWTTDLTPPEWLEAERAKLDELHRTGRSVTYEKEYLRKDGSRVPIELLVHLIRDEAGQPKYYYAFITDISARKQAEQASQRQTEALRRHNEELERFNRATVGRELDMIELKKRINALAQELGREPPYDLGFLDESE